MPPSSLTELYLELKDRQSRLGTPLESSDDFPQILALSHQINNQLIGLFLREPMSRRAALAAFHQSLPANGQSTDGPRTPKAPEAANGSRAQHAAEPQGVR